MPKYNSVILTEANMMKSNVYICEAFVNYWVVKRNKLISEK
jgi:hypothetical protein